MSKLAVGSIEGLASEGYVISVPAGSKIVQAGAVLQVLQTVKTDTFVSGTVTSGSEVDITGLSVSITPSSTSSRILVFFTVYGMSDVNNLQRTLFAARLYRGTTLIGAGDAAGNRRRVTGQTGNVGVDDGFGVVTGTHLDSPATTSSVTYKIAGVHLPFDGTTAQALYVNRTKPDTDNNFFPRAASSITVMEIAG